MRASSSTARTRRPDANELPTANVSVIITNVNNAPVAVADAATVALRLAKQTIDDGLDGDLDRGLDLEAKAFAALFDTEDRTTGIASFLENGPGKATFSGR